MSNKLKDVVEQQWLGMPEFIQEKQEPFSKIIVRFETEEDLNEFSELIGQKLTSKTKSIWHPKLQRGKHSRKRYVEEEYITEYGYDNEEEEMESEDYE